MLLLLLKMLLLLLDWDLDFFDLAIVLGFKMLWEYDADKGAWGAGFDVTACKQSVAGNGRYDMTD